MKLITREILMSLPPLYANEGKGNDALVRVKYFSPDSNWTWYATEGSPVDADGLMDTMKPKVDFLFYGLVDGLERELGYFALSDLQSGRGQLGLPIERDLHWKPKPLREVIDELNAQQSSIGRMDGYDNG